MTNRIIYYYQTFCGLEKILYEGTPVTHLHLSSIHFNIDKNLQPCIHLNDNIPYDSCFDSVWSDLNKASKLGIKCILMIGGAGLAFQTMFSNYDIYYNMLYNLIKAKDCIVGIDLDIEEICDINNIKKLIADIDQDFGEDFIITMAPLQYSLTNDNAGMGGFSYKKLYNSKEGQRINYFNTQCYFDFSKRVYDEIIANNYPSNKINIGMISGEDFNYVCKEIEKISNKYKEDFGGVFIWEYFSSPPDGPNNPSEWSKVIQKILINNNWLII
jgi:hypothetical protein